MARLATTGVQSVSGFTPSRHVAACGSPAPTPHPTPRVATCAALGALAGAIVGYWLAGRRAQ